MSTQLQSSQTTRTSAQDPAAAQLPGGAEHVAQPHGLLLRRRLQDPLRLRRALRRQRLAAPHHRPRRRRAAAAAAEDVQHQRLLHDAVPAAGPPRAHAHGARPVGPAAGEDVPAGGAGDRQRQRQLPLRRAPRGPLPAAKPPDADRRRQHALRRAPAVAGEAAVAGRAQPPEQLAPRRAAGLRPRHGGAPVPDAGVQQPLRRGAGRERAQEPAGARPRQQLAGARVPAAREEGGQRRARSNRFGGDGLPAGELASFYLLERLDVSRNRFVGPFPPALLALPSIEYLSIADNRLTGLLAGNMSCGENLRFVDLSSNLLTGSLPSCLLTKAAGDTTQHPSTFCQNQALAVGSVGIVPDEAHGKKHGGKVALVAGIVAGAIAAAVLVGVAVFLAVRKVTIRRAKSRPPRRLVEHASSAYPSQFFADARYISQTVKLGALGIPAYRSFSLVELEAATNNFEVSCLMGQDAHGQMYRGTLSNGTPVTIRSLRVKRSQTWQSFNRHIEMISKLRHCFEYNLERLHRHAALPRLRVRAEPFEYVQERQPPEQDLTRNRGGEAALGAEDTDRHRRGQGHPVPARRHHARPVREQPQDHQHPSESCSQDRQPQHPHPSRNRSEIRGWKKACI